MRWRGLKAWAARLSDEVLVMGHAVRDPEMPRGLRWLALALLAYALSPIDLIPDFIPVLGWLDDLLILPLGFAYIRRRLPPAVLARASERARTQDWPALRRLQGLRRALIWGILIVGLSLLLGLAFLGGLALWLWRQFNPI
ncbi:uncharacterized membrane protein YkvA (DUF1232 family) [Inhella inkyongensis]|uniref:Uncharacterized membrane protein YkvA (DUF1232 family) n=1 Tax=Inhella inkyongensis TaxID=392593 RepID=A0A840SA38_9BURK|nr:DUF1232 domain-containing protein [Inhella inkyongensis]MBB5205269.1 uncharacterized membrane protein YkvA (DUF1232 family) [Inhella inkyongensis]